MQSFFCKCQKKALVVAERRKKMDIKRQKLRASFRAQVHRSLTARLVERQKEKVEIEGVN